MKRVLIATATTALIAGSAVASTSLTTYTGHKLASRTKVTIVKARAAALKARPGRIIDQELEKEAGGSGLRYSFDIVSRGRTIEVGIDAVTGAVLENGAESRAKGTKEAVQEAHAKP